MQFNEIFRRKKPDAGRLAAFGFVRAEGCWSWRCDIQNGAFVLTVKIDAGGQVDTELVEKATSWPYSLYKTNAEGAFVGGIRAEIGGILEEIAKACFADAVFKSRQALAAIDFVRKTFGDELQFLWKKFPDNAVWRRKDNDKWYGAVLTVDGGKIGRAAGRMLEIIDLRMDPAKSAEVLSRKHYLPGWHMNKKSWYTLVLDGSISDRELFSRIEESYALAAN